MQNPAPHRATELLQVATTVAALAVALAALTADRGPEIDGYLLLPVVLLTAGLPALAGGLYAMAEMWSEAGMSRRDLLGELLRPNDRPVTLADSARIATAWGLGLLGIAYIFLLVDSAA